MAREQLKEMEFGTSVTCCAHATESDRLRAAGCIVGDRNRAGEVSSNSGNESGIDVTAPSNREVRATIVGFAEVGTRGNVRNVERGRAIVAQSDGLRWAHGADKLVVKHEDRGRWSGVRSYQPRLQQDGNRRAGDRHVQSSVAVEISHR